MGGDWGGPRTQGGRWPSTVTPDQCPSCGDGSVQGRASPHIPAQRAEPLTGASSSPRPLHLTACFLGLLPEGGMDGELLHYIIAEKPRGREGPRFPLTPALGPSSWLSIFLSKCASKGSPPQTLPPASESQARSSASTPTLRGCVLRACKGARQGCSAPGACGHGRSPGAETLSRTCASPPPETQSHPTG